MKILVTNASSPTFVGTLYGLRDAFDCEIIGVSKKESFEKHLLDKHYLLGAEDDYLTSVLAVCEKEKPLCLIPHSIKDRILFMQHKKAFDALNIPILSSSADSIIATESKLSFMEQCKKLDIPTPEYYIASTYEELKLFAKQLGYPEKKVVIKPVAGSGSRGLRILNKKVNYRKMFEKHRADNPETTLSNLRAIIGDKFNPLIVSQFLEGPEYTLDCLRIDEIETYIVRKRIETKNGLTSVGQIIQNDELVTYAKKIAKHYDLTTIFGFQFMEDAQGKFHILECNPRIQGTTVMSILAGSNIIAASIAKLCALEPIPLTLEIDMMYYRLHGGIGVGKKVKHITFEKKELSR